MTDTLLIVDDENDLLHGLKRIITSVIDCRILLANSSDIALGVISEEPVDVVLTDINMPGMDGISLLRKIKETDPAITVMIMTAYGTIERAVEAIKAGAYDFIQKPFDEERLLHLLRKGFERNRLVRENERLMQKVCESEPFSHMVGKSAPMQKTFKAIRMLARTDVTVLVLGATGTGKDLAARAIHDISHRRRRPMVTVNCPALPENLLESELFGYVKGAFTNADRSKEGLFENAHGSTIFLDEIGDLSPSVQTKLLRVLQEKEIKPLGSNNSREVDVRIIAATNRNLQKKMESHQFREDLYYRLNVGTIRMPSLSEIKEDIPLLVEYFLEKTACEQNIPPKQISPEVMNTLMAREWPGNIRELENTIRGWYAMTPGAVITRDIFSQGEDSVSEAPAFCGFGRSYKKLKEDAIEQFTLNYLNHLFQHTGGNISLSAKLSGIKRQSLQKIVKRYHIDINRFRK